MSKKRDSQKATPKSRICKNCGAIVPKEFDVCLICGCKYGEVLNHDENHSPHETPITANQMRNQRRISKFISFLIMILFAFSFVLVFALEYFSFNHLKSNYNTVDAIVYSQADNLLKINIPDVGESLIISDNYINKCDDISVGTSFDKRYIAYYENQERNGNNTAGNLRLLDLIKLAPKYLEEESGSYLISPDSSVIDFKFSSSGHQIIFLTSNGDLMLCDFAGTISMFPTQRKIMTKHIDSGVSGIIDYASDSILYYKGFGADTLTYSYNKENSDGQSYDLYRAALTDDSAITALVDSAVYNIESTNATLSSIIYSKKSSKSVLQEFDVYMYVLQNSASKIQILANNAVYISASNADSGELMFVTPNRQILKYSDLFEDNDYSSYALYLQNQIVQNILETGSANIEDILSSPKLEEISLRNQLRGEILKCIDNFNSRTYLSFKLMYIPSKDAENEIVEDNIFIFNDSSNVDADLKAGYALFVNSPDNNINRSDISALSNEETTTFLMEGYQIEDYISANLKESLTLFSTSSKINNVVHTESIERTISNFKLDYESKELFFLSKPNFYSQTGILYSSELNQNGVDKITYIDDRVYMLIGNMYGKSPGAVYQTASKDDPPEYNIYKDADNGVVEMASKTSPYMYTGLFGKNNNKLYFYRNYDTALEYGQLYMYENYSYYIAPRVHQYLYQERKDGKIILVQSETDGYNLLELEKENVTLLDQNVDKYYAFEFSGIPAK